MNEKPGWKTTEGWLAFIVAILPYIFKLIGVDVPDEALVATPGLATAGYSIARGLAKRK